MGLKKAREKRQDLRACNAEGKHRVSKPEIHYQPITNTYGVQQIAFHIFAFETLEQVNSTLKDAKTLCSNGPNDSAKGVVSIA